MKKKDLFLYVATDDAYPEEIKIDGNTIANFLTDFTSKYGREFELQTVNNPKYLLSKIYSLNLQEEINLHLMHPLCVIDGKYLKKYRTEIFSIRSHHFPHGDDYELFCIVSPLAGLTDEEIESEDIKDENQAIDYICSKILFIDKCVVISPTKTEFEKSLQRFRLYTIRRPIRADEYALAHHFFNI